MNNTNEVKMIDFSKFEPVNIENFTPKSPKEDLANVAEKTVELSVTNDDFLLI